MPWHEFKALLCGIGPETALGRTVSIRIEEDKEVLKNFTREQKEIRNRWRRKCAENRTQKDRDDFLESMKQAFIDMAGGDKFGRERRADRAGSDRKSTAI